MDDTRAIVVLTTFADRAQATPVVRSLVDQRLVACGTIVDRATSVYRWKGEVQEEAEVLVLLKSVVGRWHDLRETIRREHPYDEPEVVRLDVADGADTYLSWIRSETDPGSH